MSRFLPKRPEPFGKAGLTVAILALVLAMVGGAYAAGGLTKSQEKQVKKIAKKYAGKPGATGPAGPAGTNGTNGAPGKNGTNGAPGPKGEEGSPWTAGGVLPSGKTETGTFRMYKAGPNSVNETYFIDSISFPIPLPEPEHLGEAAEAEFVEQGFPTPGPGTTHCPGSWKHPTAEPGFFCLYTVVGLFHNNVNAFTLLNLEEPAKNSFVSRFGVVLGAETESGESGPERIESLGSWAVTAK